MLVAWTELSMEKHLHQQNCNFANYENKKNKRLQNSHMIK